MNKPTSSINHRTSDADDQNNENCLISFNRNNGPKKFVEKNGKNVPEN